MGCPRTYPHGLLPTPNIQQKKMCIYIYTYIHIYIYTYIYIYIYVCINKSIHMSIRRVLMDFLHDSISSTRISVLCLRRQQRSCSCHWRPLRTVVVVTLSVLLCCRSSLRLSSLQTNCVGRKVAWIHRHYHFLFLLHLKCSYMFRVITALGHGTFWRYL